MTAQLGLELKGGSALIPDALFEASFGVGDPMPAGPFSVSLTTCDGPDGRYQAIPWIVVCGDGRCVAGHVPSLAIAEAIANALNAAEVP